jgi:monofunctional biosynthetic peptidoglycan transglycosylase
VRAPALSLGRLLRYAAVPPALFLAWLLAVWPPPAWYRTHWPAATEFMRAGGGPRRYAPVGLDSISPSLVEAVLTAEDARFRLHRGIDWVEVRKALGYRRTRFDWSAAQDRRELGRAMSTARSRREAMRGASSITQQVAKNLYLSPSRSALRKLKEAVTAYRLERALGKDRILELYLNVAELGDGVWGAEAASRRYFRTSAGRLSLTQSAALAATLPFPRSSNPAYRPVRMRRRQDLILRRMRGEPVVVPRVEQEPIPQPGDSIVWTPGVDSLLDSLRSPVETLFPIPRTLDSATLGPAALNPPVSAASPASGSSPDHPSPPVRRWRPARAP